MIMVCNKIHLSRTSDHYFDQELERKQFKKNIFQSTLKRKIRKEHIAALAAVR